VGIAPKLVQERQDQMLALLRSGIGIVEVGTRVGVSRHTVRRYRDNWKNAGVDLGLHGQVDPRELALAAAQASAAARAAAVPELPLEFAAATAPTAAAAPEVSPAATPATSSEWDQPPPTPAEPTLLEVSAPGEGGAGAPLVVALELQLPVSLIALYNLMRQDGLEVTLNDWLVEAVELHFRECWGIGVGIVASAPRRKEAAA